MQSPPFATPDEIALNQAILDSLYQNRINRPQNIIPQRPQNIRSGVNIPTIPPLYVPTQTATAYNVPRTTPVVPTIPTVYNVPRTPPVVPTIPTVYNVPRTPPVVPTIPTVYNVPRTPPVVPTIPAVYNAPRVTQVSAPKMPNIPVMPPLYTTTATTTRQNAIVNIPPLIKQQANRTGGVMIPLNNTPQVPRVIIPNIPPLATNTTTTTTTTTTNISPSPPVTTPPSPLPPIPLMKLLPITDEDYDDQLRLAIMASLNENYFPGQTTVVKSPPRSPLMSPRRNQEDDLDDIDLQEAIQASMMNRELEEKLQINLRELQDIEYEEALRIDMEKAEKAERELQAIRDEAEKELQAVKVEEVRILQEEARRNALEPPVLKYPLEISSPAEIYMIRFRLPSGESINNYFNMKEPLSSVIQHLQFYLKYPGELILSNQQRRTIINCDKNTPIYECGFSNRVVINVEYTD